MLAKLRPTSAETIISAVKHPLQQSSTPQNMTIYNTAPALTTDDNTIMARNNPTHGTRDNQPNPSYQAHDCSRRLPRHSSARQLHQPGPRTAGQGP